LNDTLGQFIILENAIIISIFISASKLVSINLYISPFLAHLAQSAGELLGWPTKWRPASGVRPHFIQTTSSTIPLGQY
jgi:hypothetical protein